jgi:hypothetical protein
MIGTASPTHGKSLHIAGLLACSISGCQMLETCGQAS